MTPNVVREIEGFPLTILRSEMEPRAGGATTLLTIGRIVSALQIVERERGTIKESSRELRDKGGACRVSMSQGSLPCTEGCAATPVR